MEVTMYIGDSFDDDVRLYGEVSCIGFDLRWRDHYQGQNAPVGYVIALHEECKRRQRWTLSYWIMAIVTVFT